MRCSILRKTKLLLLGILLLAIGFAAITTTLVVTGSVAIGENKEDFRVFFSNAKVNGDVDKRLIQDDTHILFDHELSLVGDKYTLNYEVTNGSTSYDANVFVKCTDSNAYLSIKNNFNSTEILKRNATREGQLVIEMISPYLGDEKKIIDITCSIVGNALVPEEL